MFNIDILKKYIQSVTIEKAKEAENVLPLYKYGFVMKEEYFRKLKVHSGYHNTIERYMYNKTTLTKKQLMCILKYYNIDDIPEIPDIILPEQLRITFVPKPQVELDGVVELITIQFVPAPQVTIDIATIPVNLIFVPEAQVIFTVPASITYVPNVQVTITQETFITFVPKPQVTFDLDTVPPEPTTLVFVPEPQIILGYIGTTINYVPQPQVEVEASLDSGDRIYWGVLERAGTDPRPTKEDIDFKGAELSSITLPGAVPNDLLLSFDSSKRGYMVFAIPESASDRHTYVDPNGFDGYIGGEPGPFGNLWPDPELKLNESISVPRNYKIYITSYWTQPVEGNYTLKTSNLSAAK